MSNINLINKKELKNKWRAYLSENGVSIVGQDNSTHGVQKHLEHRFGSESSSDNIRDSFGGLDVGSLGDFTLLTFGISVENENVGLTSCLHIFLNFKLLLGLNSISF